MVSLPCETATSGDVVGSPAGNDRREALSSSGTQSNQGISHWAQELRAVKDIGPDYRRVYGVIEIVFGTFLTCLL